MAGFEPGGRDHNQNNLANSQVSQNNKKNYIQALGTLKQQPTEPNGRLLHIRPADIFGVILNH
jgi:hypothetical protein